MTKIENGSKSRNNRTNSILKNISSYTSDIYFDSNYFLNNNIKNRNHLNKKESDILNLSASKVINDSSINNYDINFNSENKKRNHKKNKLIYKKLFTKSNNILDNYIKRLKNFGYPEIGEIYLSSDTREQEKTFNFFDYIITKEANNLENNHAKEKEYKEFRNRYQNLESQIINLNRELNNNYKNFKNMQKDYENKFKEQKNYFEHKISILNQDNEYLTYINNKIYFKKKNLELKLYSMNKTINKFEDMKTNIITAVEEIDFAQSNDMAKMLSRVKGAEKLIEDLKAGYNESLRELSFEISSLKNLIFEIHNEICVFLDKPINIEENVYDMPFSDSIEYYKKIFNNNFNILKEKIQKLAFTSGQVSTV